MRDFYTWLKETHNIDERGIRTALGIYPPQYGAGNYPPQYFTPISSTATLQLQTNHPETLKNTNPKPKKASKKKPAKKTEKKTTKKKK